MNEKQWLQVLSRYVKPSRVEHSLGVAQTARDMACRFGADPDKAYTAGLMHDVAKGFTDGVLLSYAQRLGLDKDPIYRENPQLIHGQAASLWLKEEGWCEDPEILHAIYVHTIPEGEMSPLDRILFTADMIEPSRKPYPGLQELRELAAKDLDKLYFTALWQTLTYNIQNRVQVHPGTLIAYNTCLKEAKSVGSTHNGG